MKGFARLGDKIQGMTTGEHHGHVDPHPPCTLFGTITGGCSTKFYVDGKPAALVGSITTESDCCGGGTGTIAEGSSKMFIGGIPVARIGDRVAPHNGTAVIISGSDTAGEA